MIFTVHTKKLHLHVFLINAFFERKSHSCVSYVWRFWAQHIERGTQLMFEHELNWNMRRWDPPRSLLIVIMSFVTFHYHLSQWD